ncbi:Oidioi.mRNA.OKI2018_I69.chr2.g5979.t1.cds [Oikopleura dioica]|uniref:Oidioi.mRNA.OKI2018_I69.chr2.g5979.t1.cds n=1 Tax=Oikopleura dioica TaxID=34765 RepID=A0ABN7T249_OIKDI|nr:Oidioi.mRNA.OKI2018_I69.chr2.g5979.t1.cds [Oikopleura dioica]
MWRKRGFGREKSSRWSTKKMESIKDHRIFTSEEIRRYFNRCNSLTHRQGPLHQRKRQIPWFSHFDWSFFNTLSYNNSLEPIMMLREPMARSVSHFYFKKTMFDVTSKRENQKFMKMTMDEFFNDPVEIMRFQEIWMDTFSGVSWLAGTITNPDDYTFTSEHFKNDFDKQKSFEKLELKRLNASWSLTLAADRLESLGWFGILERMEDSERLLSYFLEENVKISHKRSTKEILGHKYPIPSPSVLKKLHDLSPLDRWLYEFANRLMDARIEELETGVFARPERPAFPTMTCLATSYMINCPNSSALSNWISSRATAEYQESFEKLLKT